MPKEVICPNCGYASDRVNIIARHRSRCPGSQEELIRMVKAIRIDSCWIPGTTAEGGRAKVRGKRAHVVALEIRLGRPLQPGMVACHSCDVGSCVNGEHLWEGTQADNLKDMWAKGRGVLKIENLGRWK